jgi:hypothetical protein
MACHERVMKPERVAIITAFGPLLGGALVYDESLTFRMARILGRKTSSSCRAVNSSGV